MKFKVTRSSLDKELMKEAEERLRNERQWYEKEGYSCEIVLVPTGVIFNEEGRASVVMNPDVQLIRK